MQYSPKPDSVPERLDLTLEGMLEMGKQQVVASIKQNGFEASKELIGRWCEKAEAWVDQEKKNRIQVGRRLIIVDTAKAEFYFATGDKEETLCCLDSASRMAEQEGHLDLQATIEARLTEVISSNV